MAWPRDQQTDFLNRLVHAPFEYLYIHGPAWMGFWEGVEAGDICAGLTMVPAKDWTAPNTVAMCTSLIQRHSHATLLGIGVVSALLGVYASINACTLRYALRSAMSNKHDAEHGVAERVEIRTRRPSCGSDLRCVPDGSFVK